MKQQNEECLVQYYELIRYVMYGDDRLLQAKLITKKKTQRRRKINIIRRSCLVQKKLTHGSNNNEEDNIEKNMKQYRVKCVIQRRIINIDSVTAKELARRFLFLL